MRVFLPLMGVYVVAAVAFLLIKGFVPGFTFSFVVKVIPAQVRLFVPNGRPSPMVTNPVYFTGLFLLGFGILVFNGVRAGKA